MSKELIVSATRHETRVAMLEDDQLVEVYFERSNEYSLAGSIHKGRVTRVLPGMQSAFVDIGLERDAFLYVSDFFEDNDEYDKVVSSVEDKILKLEKDKSAGPPAGVAALVEAAPAGDTPVEAILAAAVEAPSAATTAAPVQREERRDGRDGRDSRGGGDRDRDRRGRRGRRRRPGRGEPRLPESKFFSPRETEAPAEGVEDEPAAPAAAPVDDDFFVLPGESLAKYQREGDELMESALEEAESGELTAEAEPEAEPEPVVEVAEAVAEEPFEAAPVEAAPVFVEAEPAAEEEPAPAAVVEAAVEEAEAPAAELPETGEAAEAEAGSPAEEPVETASSEETAEAGEESEAAVETAGETSEVEPARMPHSLTAQLREQGGRFPHRVSRRMRRRQRGGGAPGEERAPQEGRGPQEGRSPEGRNQDGRNQEVRGQASEPRPQAESRQPRPDPRPQRIEGRPAQPTISELLKEGQEILVQIAKEPLGQKGARITSHIALPGRFLVYMPTVDHIGVSRKIASDEERQRLKRVLQTHRTGIPGGYIVRTAGEGHTEEEVKADMLFLYNLWLDLRQKAEKRPAPALIHHDLDVVQRVLRDQLNAQYKNIWVDNEEVYTSILSFVQRFQPALVNRVKLYTRSTPIFEAYGITAELEKALRPKVWLKSGGYIVINQTEALVAIDINTGKYVGKSNRLEDTIVKTNTDAIKEIVRQIRLRDLGGIIVVDFIDMDERKNRQKVMQALEEAMRADRAPYKILQFNDFGLVAITRKRVKQSLERALCTPCPTCEGAGYVKSTQTVIGEILVEARKMAKALEGENVTLRVNPEVAKVLKSSRNQLLQEIEETLGRVVMVKSDPLLHPEKFDLA